MIGKGPWLSVVGDLLHARRTSPARAIPIFLLCIFSRVGYDASAKHASPRRPQQWTEVTGQADFDRTVAGWMVSDECPVEAA